MLLKDEIYTKPLNFGNVTHHAILIVRQGGWNDYFLESIVEADRVFEWSASRGAELVNEATIEPNIFPIIYLDDKMESFFKPLSSYSLSSNDERSTVFATISDVDYVRFFKLDDKNERFINFAENPSIVLKKPTYISLLKTDAYNETKACFKSDARVFMRENHWFNEEDGQFNYDELMDEYLICPIKAYERVHIVYSKRNNDDYNLELLLLKYGVIEIGNKGEFSFLLGEPSPCYESAERDNSKDILVGFEAFAIDDNGYEHRIIWDAVVPDADKIIADHGDWKNCRELLCNWSDYGVRNRV